MFDMLPPSAKACALEARFLFPQHPKPYYIMNRRGEIVDLLGMVPLRG